MEEFVADLRERKVDAEYAKAVPTFGLDEMNSSKNVKKGFTILAYRNSDLEALKVLQSRKIVTKVRKPKVEWICGEDNVVWLGGMFKNTGLGRGIVKEPMALHILEANPDFMETHHGGAEYRFARSLTTVDEVAMRIRVNAIANGYKALYSKFATYPTSRDLKIAVDAKEWGMARWLFEQIVPTSIEERPNKRVRIIDPRW